MTEAPSRLSPADWAAAITVVVLWGFNFAVVKVGLRALPPFLLTAMRFAGVAMLLAPFYRPRLEQLPGIALLGLLMGVLHFGLLFYGIADMDAATAAIAIQLGVPFSALAAWVFFRERLGWRRAGGMALAFSGVALLAGEPSLPDPRPLLLLVASAACWALSNVVVKRLGAISPMALNGWMALFAAPMLLAVSLAIEDDQLDAVAHAGWEGWLGVVYTTLFASVVAYSLWYHLLGRHPLNRVVPFTLLGPGIGVASGILLLGEAASWQKLLGGLLTVAGVAAIQLQPTRSPSPEIRP